MKKKDKSRKNEVGTSKLKYTKPQIVGVYSENELKKEFGFAYGQTFVDLFGRGRSSDPSNRDPLRNPNEPNKNNEGF